ncbi:phosphoprotein ECPP44-like [Salvia splendens]|uniref:phosphoprotein ECPP44-like n=1 Tax=Salvia splendens TaxID=180675 RepID=UPI001C276A21|nr:phosphoprotein ECPP44-like [Salvia splendens]
MAHQTKIPQAPTGVPLVETQDHGCFDFLTNKGEKKTKDVVMTDPKEEKHTLMDELRRTHSQSSCSSDEEGGERKKKKGLKEEIKDILSGKKEGEDNVPIQEGNAAVEQPEEKKGFLEKVIEKLPGQHKNGDVETPPATEHELGCENNQKKGIIDKIKEKLPGHHKKNENEVKN